jgi:hypothetical protein
MQACTPAGMKFLQAAFGAPDFQSESADGIPDAFSGRVLVKRQRWIQSIQTSSSKDIYIALLPTPGVPFWIGDINAGVTPQPVSNPISLYPQLDTTAFNNAFPGTNEDNNFSSFRYIGQSIELVCTSNQMTWQGSIQLWKGSPHITWGAIPGAGSQVAQDISGTQNIIPSSDCYLGSADRGVYSVCTQDQPDWEFTPIVVNSQTAFKNGEDPDPNNLFYLQGNFVGFGNLNSIFIKLPATSQTTTYQVRTWADIEYQVNVSSLSYEFARASPGPDPMALEAYREASKKMPIAVIQEQNAGFFKRLFNFFGPFRRFANMIPGAYGGAARVVNGLMG